jgi:hypothetical protein
MCPRGDSEEKREYHNRGENTMRRRISAFCLVATLATAVHLSAPAQAEDPSDSQKSKLVEFDAPGATKTNSPVCTPYCGTFAYANNDFGAIVGFYTDEKVVPHGFLRTPDGHFISFNVPGDGEGAGLNQGTAAYAINDLGAITGQYEDSKNVYHGFVREPGGEITKFNAPGAGTAANQGTFAWSLNWEGATAGVFIDGNNSEHGFLRSRDGDFSTIDPQGSVFTMVCEETCLNRKGQITGSYEDSSNALHGFLRDQDGKVTVIDAPGAVGFTGAASINDEGTITGYFADAKSLFEGFIRTSDGKFTTFQVPAGGTSAGQGTAAFSINLFAAVAGAFVDANNVYNGYSRSPGGTFTDFSAQGAGKGAGQGTRPSTNNREGDVAGWWIDGNNLNHGFVWYSDQRHSCEDDSAQDQ